MTELSELFAEQRSNVVDCGGTPIFGFIEFDDVPTRMRLTFLAVAERGEPDFGDFVVEVETQ